MSAVDAQAVDSQVLDRLCASHLYREALVCEKHDEAGDVETLLQVAVVLQNSYHEPPTGLREGLANDDRPGNKKQPSSPTAVQRLAALSVGSLGGQPQASSSKKHAHRRKKVRMSSRGLRCAGDPLRTSILQHVTSGYERGPCRVQKAQPQRVVRMKCDGLHVSVVSRFLLDCAYFGREVVAMKDAVVGSSSQQVACPVVEGYRTITEVLLLTCH